MGFCEESFFNNLSLSLSQFMEAEESFSDENDSSGEFLRDEKAVLNKSFCHDQKVAKFMHWVMKAFEAKGYVFGIISKDCKAISGSSPNLEQWWKDQCFSYKAPRVIAKYGKKKAILDKLLKNNSKRFYIRPSLSNIRDTILSFVLSALIKKCNPPQRNFPFGKGVPPPWWPTGNEEWLPQLNLKIQGPPPYKMPHDLKKDSKVMVIMAAIKHLCVDVQSVRELMLEANALTERLSTEDYEIWLHVLCQEEERLEEIDPAGMFSPASSSKGKDIVTNDNSNCDAEGEAMDTRNVIEASNLPNHQFSNMEEAAERQSHEGAAAAHQIWGGLNGTNPDLTNMNNHPSANPYLTPFTGNAITPIADQSQNCPQLSAGTEHAPFDVQPTESMTFDADQLFNQTSYNNHQASQEEVDWNSFLLWTDDPVQQVNENGVSFSKVTMADNSNVLDNNNGFSPNNYTMATENQQQQQQQDNSQLQVEKKLRANEASSGSTPQNQHGQSSNRDPFFDIMDPNVYVPELNPVSSSNLALEDYGLDLGQSNDAFSWFYCGE